jgi:hypothetical protein
MPTDFRALCAELTDALDNAVRVVHAEDGTQRISTAQPVLARARAALSGSCQLRNAFVAELDRVAPPFTRLINWSRYVSDVLTAALVVVLPDDPDQLGPSTDYDYSRIQRQVERRAIKARFLELIDSLAVDRD